MVWAHLELKRQNSKGSFEYEINKRKSKRKPKIKMGTTD
jgi:hypothetical protein